jgi:hypothetical protein
VEIKKRFSNEYYRLASLLLTTFELKTKKERDRERERVESEREGGRSHWKEKRSINSQSLDLNFNGDLWESKEKHCMEVVLHLALVKLGRRRLSV